MYICVQELLNRDGVRTDIPVEDLEDISDLIWCPACTSRESTLSC